ncbi:MAG: lipopolysaccharide transport periplasmic protein LptA [Nitrosomonadales bacterium]|nr:lipopolysaccharide transport periplasmic protein LptA [Nitrosomonadales bacterium]
MSRYPISAVLPGLLFILSSPPLHAENADRDKPLHLESDSVSIDDVKQVSVFEGVVELVQGTLTIHADKIVVKQNKLGYKHCTATGKTASFRQKLEGADEYVEGYGERIEYDTRAETVDFFVQARVKRGQDDVRGDRITYNTRTEVIRVSGNPRNITSPTKGRVRAVIQPKSNETDTTPKDAPLVIQSSPTLTSPKR